MYRTVEIDGSDVGAGHVGDGEIAEWLDDPPESVYVTWPERANGYDAGRVCVHCGEPVVELARGWVHEDPTDKLHPDQCNGYDGGVDGSYADSGGTFAAPAPLGIDWANSAAIHVDDERQTISFTVSLGDPRGALQVAEIWKAPADETSCRWCGKAIKPDKPEGSYTGYRHDAPDETPKDSIQCFGADGAIHHAEPTPERLLLRVPTKADSSREMVHATLVPVQQGGDYLLMEVRP